jgi:hypothetical protein
MRDHESNTNQQAPKGDSNNGKKPFVEPEMKEFTDLEMQVRQTMIGTFTP